MAVEPDTARTVVEWFQLLGLGAFGGALGQGVRPVVGLKKLNDAASATPGASASDMIDPSRLVVSLLIGAIAGALAATGIIKDLQHIPPADFFALAAAGYSGADFIEGFMNRMTPTGTGAAGSTASANSAPTGTSSATSDGAAG